LTNAKRRGSIVKTSENLNSFFEALFTGKVLSEESLISMKTIKDRFGMELFRYKTNYREGFRHRGRIDEFRATSIYFPKEKLSFKLISNGSKGDISEVYTEILKLYLNDASIEISKNKIEKFLGVYISQSDP